MPRTHARTLLTLGAVLALAPAAGAQSFYEYSVELPTNELGEPDPDAPLRAVSLYYIDVPQPKKFAVHDLITLIIDETSSAESKQTLDTKKDYDLSGDVGSFPDLLQLLELRLEAGDRDSLAALDLGSKQKFKGEGTAKRSDRFVARITAEIIDVKPNGNLVVEARKLVESQDGEAKTIVLSGVCRQEDITDANTVNSSQLADLRLSQTTTGEVTNTAKKGFIPRVLEAIFNF
ncbi:MAG: flagellar basal body L-ring protein FlgH [Phycisphaerales bacterium]|nr:flagellar basal body L-ring protein FlgH [Phycisphaerales bacterium]